MKSINVSIFSFIVLNLVKKGILDPSWYYSRWHVYERSNWKLPLWSTLRENYGRYEIINFNYHCSKSSQLKSFFFTVLTYLQDSLQCNQFIVPFMDNNSRSEEKYLKISQNEQEKIWVGVSFFIKTSGLELYEK